MSMSITQRGFINRILNRYNKNDLKPSNTPYLLGLKLEQNLEKAPESNINQFQQEISSLIYITIFTRPDLTFSVNFLARFMANPSPDHFKALDRIWAYLKTTSNYALNINYLEQQSSKTKLNILGYSNAD